MPFNILETTEPQRQRLRYVLVASRTLVVLLIVSGIAALLGWILGVSWLTAPVPGWRAMAPGTAFCAIAIGVALWGRIEGKNYTALIAGGVALLLSVGSILGNLFDQLLLAGGTPLPSAVLTATAAVGLMSGVMQARKDIEKITLVVSGMALVALTVTVTFAHTIGVFDIVGSERMPGSSLQLIVAALLLGLCFMGLVWVGGLQELELPDWLPWAAGLAGLVTVMSLWSALATREREQTLEGAQQAALAESRLLSREIEASTRSLKRAAGWAASDVPDAQQERDIRALERDIPSLLAVHHLTDDGMRMASLAQSADAEPVIAQWRAYTQWGKTQPDTVMYLPLDSAANRFVIYVPVCATRCAGAMAGVFRSAALFRSLSTDTLSTYRYSIAGPNGPLDGAPGWVAPTFAATTDLRLGQVQWTVTAWPSANAMTTESNLPGAVLFMGLVVTLLLPLTIQLGRSAWEGARDRERSRLSRALDRATDGIWEIDLLTGLSIRSATLWRHLKYPPDAVPPHVDGWSALIHPDDRTSVEAALSRHVAGESDSYETEYRVRAGDGEWHDVVDRGRIVDHTALGAPARLLGISADVTEARTAAKAREESEQRFRALFNSSFQFQLLLTGDGRVLEVNRVALEHAGLQAADVLDQVCWETLWWPGNGRAQETLRRARAAAVAGDAQMWEEELVQEGRPPMILEFSLKPIRNAHGMPVQLLLEGRDITERVRADAWLKEVDTLTTMGRVAARVAHEINNPLAGIQHAFLLIKDAVPQDHQYFRYVGSIEREIDRISKVTRQLYETYRPEHDATGTASLKLVVADAVAFLEQVNKSRHVSIETDLSGVTGAVPVPAAMLRQIVYNLVQNAIDASPADGVVRVEAEITATSVELRVKDQGRGVPDALRAQIFEPFFSTKERAMKTSGMGLGLALVRRTVAAAGGTIAVDTNPGGGAAFLVALPLAFDDADDSANESSGDSA